MKFEALRFEHSDTERALLRRLADTPADVQRSAVRALDDNELYLVQLMVGIAYDRRVEADVDLKRAVDEVVRWRFPRGWPSPASSIPVGADTGA